MMLSFIWLDATVEQATNSDVYWRLTAHIRVRRLDALEGATDLTRCAINLSDL
jgi:hypothetical protein